ncbi:MAG: type II toxin-antitoxin system VapC family toxin [Aquisalimonadaceae bacterium]
MYLIDTNIISEARKGSRANPGVQRFFRDAAAEEATLFLSVVTVGELQRGVELIRHRGDLAQASTLERWLTLVLVEYRDYVLDIDSDIAQLWGTLRAPHSENALDKFIAATALIYDFTLVTRNGRDFKATGVRLLNPFEK